MMQNADQRVVDFTTLAAPSEDGAALVVPAWSEFAVIAERNRARRRSSPPLLLGEPAGPDESSPFVVATGHQPEFIHAGVWAKNVVAGHVARAVGGRFDFVVVDSDAAADAALRWPLNRDGRLAVASQPLPHAAAGVAFEQLSRAADPEWAAWFAGVPPEFRADPDRCFPDFEAGFRGPSDADYVARLMSGYRALDRRLGVASPCVVRVSELESGGVGATWTRFVAHILSNSRAFADAYNRSLAAYRAPRRIRGVRHPMPDLLTDVEWCELPFWIMPEGRPRQRLVVRQHGDRMELVAGEESAVTLDIAALRRAPGEWRRVLGPVGRLRPRALALTLFIRLFASDLFIHGLGGAKYDPITDELIRRFFGVPPPEYACVTATLRLPLRRAEGTIERLRAIRRELRDRRFNPQRHLSDGARPSLLAERIAAIEESDRLRRDAPPDRERRRAAYERLVRVNAALASYLRPGPTADDVGRLAAGVSENRIADDREWFVGLHPARRLEQLCDRLLAS